MKLRKELRRFDKNVIRPVRDLALEAVAFLDRTVPGWTVLASVLTPALPFMPLVTLALQAGSAAGTIASGAAAIATGSVSSLIPGLSPITDLATRVVELPLDMQRQAADIVKQAGQEWGQRGAKALEPVKITLARAAARYVEERGPLEAHVEALAVEVVQGAALCATVALMALSLGAATPLAATPGAFLGAHATAAGTSLTFASVGAASAAAAQAGVATTAVIIQSLSVALTAATEGHRVLRAYELAQAVKKEARQQRDAALAEAGRIEREERALLAEIEALRAARLARQSAVEVPPAEASLATDDPATTAGKAAAFAVGVALLAEVLS